MKLSMFGAKPMAKIKIASKPRPPMCTFHATGSTYAYTFLHLFANASMFFRSKFWERKQ